MNLADNGLPDQTIELEEHICCNDSVYHILYYFTQLQGNGQIESPIYVCDHHKYQLIFDLASNNLLISIKKDNQINILDGTIFDLFIENLDPEKTIKFDQASQLPLQTNLNIANLTPDSGWIHKTNVDSLKIDFIVKNKESASMPRYIIPQSMKTIKLSISNLSDLHIFEPINIEYATMTLMLSLEDSTYNLSINLTDVQANKFLFKSKIIIHNKDPSKNLNYNLIKYVVADVYNDISLSELNSDEINEENGWFNNGCFLITIQYSIPQKQQINTLLKPKASISTPKINNYICFPVLDFYQTVQLNNFFNLLLPIPLENAQNKDYRAKIRVGKTFVYLSFDLDNNAAYFTFEDTSDHYVILDVTVQNKHRSKNVLNKLSQEINKTQNTIVLDLPFNSKNAEQSGFIDSNNIMLFMTFNIPNQMENPSFFPPIQLSETTGHEITSYFQVRFDIPTSYLDSPSIILPELQFNDKAINIYVNTWQCFFDFFINVKSEPFMLSGDFIIPSRIPANSKICRFGSFKFPFLESSISNLHPSDILNPNLGYLNLENNTFTLYVRFTVYSDTESHVSLIQGETKYVSYESKHPQTVDSKPESVNSLVKPHKPQKYAGLINQGATCYMNSMLQAFFHCPSFRHIVYSMPTTGNEEHPEKSIALNLQRLFCMMQLSNGMACSTTELTKSFGWSTADIMVQHDIEEFCRVLMDNLETKMKGDQDLEKAIPELFQGKVRRIIRCKNIDYQTFSEQTFLDVSLEVKGCPTLADSFDKYIAKEEMTGDNKYTTDKYGKQDVVMNLEFAELPPILHIHLQRFVFDPQTLGMAKVNDYFEFPEQIDLTKYLTEDSPSREKSNLYDLYGVLVHSGSINGGHYNAYLRPSTDNQWYFFNDSSVTAVPKEKAIQSNYGFRDSQKQQMKNVDSTSFDFLGMKEELSETLNSGKQNKSSQAMDYYSKIRSGYMLIYVRHEDAPMIYQPISTDSIPEHLVEYSMRKLESKSYSAYSHEGSSKNVSITLYDEESVKNRFLGYESKEHNLTYENANVKLSDIYQNVSEIYNIPIDQLRIWSCQTYYRKPPEKIIPNTNKALSDCFKFFRHMLVFFVQKKDIKDPLDVPNHHVVFLLFFYPKADHPLQFIKTALIPKGNTQAMLTSCINEMIASLGLPQNAKLEGYLITTQNKPQKIDAQTNGSWTYSSISQGANVILTPIDDEEYPEIKDRFQSKEKDGKATAEKQETTTQDNVKVHHLSNYIKDSNCNSLLSYFNNMSQIELDIFDFSYPKIPLFRLVASTKATAQQLYHVLSKLVMSDYNPKKDFFLIYTAVYSETGINVAELGQKARYGYQSPLETVAKSKILPPYEYHRLYVSYHRNCGEDFEYRLPVVQISFNSLWPNDQALIPLYSKSVTFNSFAEAVKHRFDLENGRYRLLVIRKSSIIRLISDQNSDQTIPFDTKIDDSKDILRFEPIPESQTPEKLAENNGFLIRFAFAREIEYSYNWQKFENYGEPFMFNVIPDEVFSTTRQRLKEFMQLPDNDSIDHYQFKICIKKDYYSQSFIELLPGMKLSEKCDRKTIIQIFRNEEKKPKTKAVRTRSSNDIKIYN